MNSLTFDGHTPTLVNTGPARAGLSASPIIQNTAAILVPFATFVNDPRILM